MIRIILFCKVSNLILARSIQIVYVSKYKTHFMAFHYREIHYGDHKIRRVSDANYYWY